MLHYLRARGLSWAAPGTVLAVLLGAYFAHWLEAKPQFGHQERIPAIVLGALLAAVLAAPGHHRVDDELEGSTPRPTCSGVVPHLCARVRWGTVGGAGDPLQPLERGGLELARDLLGLAGLALLAGAVIGSRLAWVLPLALTALSYFTVARNYEQAPSQVWTGWLMFPATWPATWIVAAALALAGVAAYAWGGFIPRPRRHPLR